MGAMPLVGAVHVPQQLVTLPGRRCVFKAALTASRMT